MQNQQNLRFIVGLRRPVVVLRPGRPEVRILPVAPRAAPYGVLLFLFFADFMGQQKGGFEQPVPRALRPAGQKRPGGAFLGRGLANPPGRTKSSTLRGAALFVFCGFYGAVKEGIRTARVPRFASRGAETPRWGVSRARLGESSRSHQEQYLAGCCSFCFLRILWGSKRRDSNSPCPALCVPRGRNAPVGRF